MAKNFFQDMIRIKSEIRKEIGEKPDAPKDSYTPKLEYKTEASTIVKPVTKTESKPKVVAEPKVEPKPEPKVEVRKAGGGESWSPMVSNRVESRVELLTGEAGRRPRYSLWLVAGASLIFLFFAVSFLFAKASVTIRPKMQELALNQNLLASKEASGEDALAFDLIALPGEEVKTIAGGEVKDVTLPAKGTVIIYNNYSSATQRLDIDTRLEGSNGKIYKTERAITVPGMKGGTPGSIEVGIYASETGDSYNSSPLDFQIFGFKGTAKYSKFYARSKGDITGGFKGKVATVTESDKKTTSSEMQLALKDKLVKRAAELIPEGFILFPDAITFTLDSETFGASPTDTTEVPVSVKGTLYGLLFNEKDLTKKIAESVVPNYDGSEVFISNIHELLFSLLSQESTPGDIRNISFNLSGVPNFVWKFDEEKLLDEITGRGKNDFNQILSEYPNIEGADVVLRPIWRRSFPTERESIDIKVNYPEQK